MKQVQLTGYEMNTLITVLVGRLIERGRIVGRRAHEVALSDIYCHDPKKSRKPLDQLLIINLSDAAADNLEDALADEVMSLEHEYEKNDPTIPAFLQPAETAHERHVRRIMNEIGCARQAA